MKKLLSPTNPYTYRLPPTLPDARHTAPAPLPVHDTRVRECQHTLHAGLVTFKQDLTAFVDAVATQADYPTYIATSPSDVVAPLRRTVAQQFADLFYWEDEPAGSVRTYPGLLGMATDTLARIPHLNDQKSALKQVLVTLSQYRVVNGSGVEPLDEYCLDHITVSGWKHLPRLNRRQATRHIQLVDTPILQASFIWAQRPVHHTYTVADLRSEWTRHARLAPHPDKAAEWLHALDSLATLPDNELLTKVYPGKRREYVNVIREGEDKPAPPIPAMLPLCYPARPGQALPDYLRPLPSRQDRDRPPRRPRRRVQLRDTPELRTPHWALYRFRDPRFATASRDQSDTV